jgi:TolB-like protein
MLAVMPLVGQGVDSVSAMIVTDALTDEFMRSSSVRVMERSQMEKILKEQGFQQSGLCDVSECAVQIGRLLAIDNMVVGSVGKLGDSYILTARMVDVGSGELLGSSRIQHAGAIEKITSELVPKVVLELVSAVEKRRIRSTLASGPQESTSTSSVRQNEEEETNADRATSYWFTGANAFMGVGVAYGSNEVKGSTGAIPVPVLGLEFIRAMPTLEPRLGVGIRHRYATWDTWYYGGNELNELALGLNVLAAWKIRSGLALRGGVDLEVPLIGTASTPDHYSAEGVHPLSGGVLGVWTFPSAVIGAEVSLTRSLSLTVDGAIGHLVSYGLRFSQLTAKLGYRL